MLTIYTAVYVPLSLVFEEANWPGSGLFDAVLDLVFLADVIIKLRTSHTVRGRVITDPRKVAEQYIHSWFVIDLGSTCFPLGIVLATVQTY